MNALAGRTTVPIRVESDIVRVRHRVREHAVAQGFSLIEQTKLVTAASELARNTWVHGGGGEAVITTGTENGKPVVRIVFADSGPGIADVDRALTDGFTTGDGLGLGLGGARRLVEEFSVESVPGAGTTVTISSGAGRGIR